MTTKTAEHRRGIVLQFRAKFPFNCFYCGVTLRSKVNENEVTKRTIDHVIPLSKGGADKKFNRVPCCNKCNASKGDLSVEEFRLKLYNADVKFFFEVVL